LDYLLRIGFCTALLAAWLPGLQAQEASLEIAYENYRHFDLADQPDSARHYLLLTQRYWKDAPRSARKKVTQQGFSPTDVRTLKTQLQEKIVLRALEAQNAPKIRALLAANWILPDSLQQRMLQQVNADAALQLLHTDSFEVFLKDFQLLARDISIQDPERYQALLLHARNLYFAQYDPTQLPHLIYFADLFPEWASHTDSLLARAVQKQQYLEVLEQYLSRWDTERYPLTLDALMEAYLQYGDPADYRYFYQKYPGAPAVDSLPIYLDQLQQGLQDPGFFMALSSRLTSQNFAYQLLVKNKHIPPTGIGNTAKAIVYSPIPFSDRVNTEAREYAPLRSADGKLLYFCRKVNGQEDIYVSRLDSGGWTTALPLDAINHPSKNDAPLSISADGRLMLIFREGIVHWTEKNKWGWQPPQPLFPAEYQSRWQGISSISADKQVVIFAARRKENLGLTAKAQPDIFFAQRQADGSWSAPQPLGDSINTPFTERSPFLHPDMRTLYFSSDGHKGMGGLDVFKTTRMGEDWTTWTTPVNLGPGINTSEDDWGYKVTTDGQMAYFASGSPTTAEDIFEIPLPEAVRPEKVQQLEGILTDARGTPLSGKILVIDTAKEALATIITADPGSGYFYTTLPQEKTYRLLVLSPYAAPLYAIGTADTTNPSAIRVSMLRDSLSEIQPFVIPGLQFDTDQSVIQPRFFELLNQLAEWIVQSRLQLEIHGHTDDVGSPEYNQNLSLQRAAAVRNYLIAAGCRAEDLDIRGMGLSAPLDKGNTPEARSKNRRVEMHIRGWGGQQTK
jgi:outer membrane protein OmpA-like peptidoglycan-associated protein